MNIGRMIKRGGAIALLMMLALPASAASATSRVVPIVDLSSGVNSQVDHVAIFYLTDEAGWQRFWSAHLAGMQPVPPAPAVDFSKQAVIAFFAGPRPTASYRVRIREVSDGKDRVRLDVLETAADLPGCGGLAQETQPFHIVAVPLLEGRKRFDYKLTVKRTGCDDAAR